MYIELNKFKKFKKWSSLKKNSHVSRGLFNLINSKSGPV